MSTPGMVQALSFDARSCEKDRSSVCVCVCVCVCVKGLLIEEID
jgi:hypothetical protein